MVFEALANKMTSEPIIFISFVFLMLLSGEIKFKVLVNFNIITLQDSCAMQVVFGHDPSLVNVVAAVSSSDDTFCQPTACISEAFTALRQLLFSA